MRQLCDHLQGNENLRLAQLCGVLPATLDDEPGNAKDFEGTVFDFSTQIVCLAYLLLFIHNGETYLLIRTLQGRNCSPSGLLSEGSTRPNMRLLKIESKYCETPWRECRCYGISSPIL